MDEELGSLGDHLGVLRRRWVSLVVLTVLGGVLGALVSVAQPTVYEAQSRVLVAAPVSATQGRSSLDATDIATQAEVVRSDGVVQEVLAELGLEPTRENAEDLVDSVDVAVTEGTSVLTIAVARPTAEEAAAVANQFARSYLAGRAALTASMREELVAQISEVDRRVESLRADLPEQSERRRDETRATIAALSARRGDLEASLLLTDPGSTTAPSGQILRRATEPLEPRARLAWDVALGAFLGLVLGLVWAYARDGRAGGRRDRG